MQRRISQTLPKRVITVLIAAILVWVLLFAVEHQVGAQALPHPASHAAPAARVDPPATAAKAAAAAQSAVVNAATAQLASSEAIAQANQAIPQLEQHVLPPPAESIVCAALLRARAILVALGPPGRAGLVAIDRLLTLFGCQNISTVATR